VQGSLTVLITGIRVRPFGEEELDHLLVFPPDCVVERSPKHISGITPDFVDIRSGRKEFPDFRQIAIVDCIVQGISSKACENAAQNKEQAYPEGPFQASFHGFDPLGLGFLP
jgi:hypothetical protein